MTKDHKIGPYPDKPSGKDAGYEVHKLAIQALDAVVPFSGTIGSKVVDYFVGAPLQARRDEWFRQLGGLIEEMLDEGVITQASLQGNEEFVSVVAQATTAAMRTHLEEKREALANAAINTARGVTLDEVLRATFMGYIERFSPSHLKVLRLLADPSASAIMKREAATIYAGSQKHVLRAAAPELGEDVLDRILADLNDAGMLNGSIGGLATGGSMLNKRTTPVGDAFVTFVSRPTA